MDVNAQQNKLNVSKNVFLSQQAKNPSPHILLVEDSTILQEVTKYLLQQLNCTVCMAKDGKTFWEQMNTNKHLDLIFMDLQLPDTNGILLTKQLRRRCIHTPVIALTAEAESLKTQCFQAGMDGFVQKPINIETLKRIFKIFI